MKWVGVGAGSPEEEPRALGIGGAGRLGGQGGEVQGAAEGPLSGMERRLSHPPMKEAPVSHAPSPNQGGDFLRPSCWPFEESESERGKR